MSKDGSGEWFLWPDEGLDPLSSHQHCAERLDSLFPADTEIGVSTHSAIMTYVGAMMDLVSRHGRPLTILAIAADSADGLCVGSPDARLIGAAMARCLKQETRIHDVVGRGRADGATGVSTFVVALPLLSEAVARAFAERLREAMATTSGSDGPSWLTISIGAASLSIDIDSPQSLIYRAEEALMRAQRAGGNRVWCHSDTIRRISDSNTPDTPPQ